MALPRVRAVPLVTFSNCHDDLVAYTRLFAKIIRILSRLDIKLRENCMNKDQDKRFS